MGLGGGVGVSLFAVETFTWHNQTDDAEKVCEGRAGDLKKKENSDTVPPRATRTGSGFDIRGKWMNNVLRLMTSRVLMIKRSRNLSRL